MLLKTHRAEPVSSAGGTRDVSALVERYLVGPQSATQSFPVN